MWRYDGGVRLMSMDYILAEKYWDAQSWCQSAGIDPKDENVKIICGVRSMAGVRLAPDDRWKNLGVPAEMRDQWGKVLHRSGRIV
jgi:hypothetical protein